MSNESQKRRKAQQAAVEDMTIEERLTDLERRLDALESSE